MRFAMTSIHADGTHLRIIDPQVHYTPATTGEDGTFLTWESKTVSGENLDDSQKSTTHRETWSRKSEYILSMVGYCVGLANIWRFPYVCMRNGGGVFLIPFFVCLTLCALPVFFLEVSLGQYISKGPLHVWAAICPLFKGIGVSMNVLCFLVAWYYTIILAWALIYLVNSFQSPLPWTLCRQSWNSPNCVTPGEMINGSRLSGDVTTNLTNGLTDWIHGGANFTNNSGLSVSNETLGEIPEVNTSRSRTSAEEFWLYNVLEISPGLEDMNGLPWHTTVALLVATLMVFLGIVKGIRSSGKVVYVTAVLPYILLTVLLIKGATLPGAIDGINFYVRPDFKKLLLFQTWIEASIQVFYSLGPAYGTIVTLASYNKFHNNCLRDSVFLSFVCEGTSVYGGLAIFTVVGHMAHASGVPIENFTRTGSGLAFVVYPEAVSYLPIPQLWGVLFFLMLVSLGLDSLFTTLETILTTIIDLYPDLLSKRRTLVTAVFMSLVFLVSLPFAARGGIYIFQLVDWYVAAFTLVVIAIMECTIVSWIYGAERILSNIQLMLGKRPPYLFIIMWKVVTPGLLMIVLGSTLATYKPPTFGDYHYDTWGQMFGWMIALVTFLPIPIWAVLKIKATQGTLLQKIRTCCEPTEDWTPIKRNRPSSDL